MTRPVVRTATADDLDATLELVRVSLEGGNVPRTRAYLEWKHLANPFGSSYLLVAESGGAIVGLRAFMRWTWWSGDQPVSAVRAVDTATHPDWRGRGVFKELTLAMVERVRSEGVAFVFNTPNKQSLQGYLKMGWQEVGRLAPWVRVRILGGTSPRGEADFAGVGELLEAPGIDTLLAARAVADDPRLTTRLDPAYLRWRYAEAPGLAYHAVWQLGNGGGAALIFRIRARSRRTELRLCEVLCTPDAKSVRQARALIREAARRAGADYVTALAPPRSTERRVVELGGFVPLPRMGPLLTVRPLHTIAVDPVKRQSWRPSIGALELF